MLAKYSINYDEWRVYSSCDANVAQTDTGQRVDHFWRAVFCLKSSDGRPKYMVLPEVVKADTCPDKINAESERSLFVNAHIVTYCRNVIFLEKQLLLV